MGRIDADYEKLYRRTAGDGIEIPENLSPVLFFDILSGGDITKWDIIEELPYLMCLNKLTLIYYDNEIKKDQYKRNKR